MAHTVPVIRPATLVTLGTGGWATSRDVVSQVASATGPEGEHLLYGSFEWTASMDTERVAGKAMESCLLSLL